MENKPTVCEACSASTIVTKTLENGNITETNTIERIATFGKDMFLCNICVKKEEELSLANARDNTPYRETLTGKIEYVVEQTVKVTNTVDKWQDIYNGERKAWLVENFESTSAMREALVEFIVSLETMEFQTKAKMRAAKDSARELDARLSRKEREDLINDPNFKAPENSEFKKKVKTTRESKEDRAVKALMGLGLSESEAKKQLGQV